MPKLDLGQVVGPRGPQGEQGEPGERGLQGIQGEPGKGVPEGGLSGQVLVKASNEEYNTTWGVYVVNKNLLHNWYFVGGGSQQGGGQFPINQRGATEYTTETYGIDRFYKSSSLTLKVESSCITISTALSGSGISQLLETFPTNTRLTLSILLADNTLWYLTVTTPVASPSADTSYGSVVIGDWDISLFYWNARKSMCARCRSNKSNPKPLSIVAMKLELGDQQTLAHLDADGNWVLNEIPDYATELMKCQRYQIEINPYRKAWTSFGIGWTSETSEAYVLIPVPATLRIGNPTPTFSNGLQLRSMATKKSYPVTNIKTTSISSGGCFLVLNVDGELTTGDMYWFQTLSDGNISILLDANL